VLALFLSAAAIGIAEARHTFHPLYGVVPVGWHLTGYLVWALLQQFILQDYFLARLLRLLPNPTGAVFAAAGLFALAHLPNPVLTVATLVFGTAACFVFLRYRNLYTLGLAHFILGMTIAVTVSNAAHHHMRVGLGYLRYRAHHGSAQPQSPYGVDRGVRDGGGGHAPILPPSPAVEPSRNGRK
jgi:membrane protease YdiL (CAAX protease family)